MSEIKHKQHIFEWIAVYKDTNDTTKILNQFDEDSEYYSKENELVPFVPVVMNILNRENRLLSFHLVPRGKPLTLETVPRYTVDLEEGSFQVNGQLFKLLPKDIQLSNYRLIYYFSPVKVGAIGSDDVLHQYIRLYKLGLQANDEHGKNYQKIMIWNAEDEAITIHDRR